jgi:hypothetical protein
LVIDERERERKKMKCCLANKNTSQFHHQLIENHTKHGSIQSETFSCAHSPSFGPHFALRQQQIWSLRVNFFNQHCFCTLAKNNWVHDFLCRCVCDVSRILFYFYFYYTQISYSPPSMLNNILFNFRSFTKKHSAGVAIETWLNILLTHSNFRRSIFFLNSIFVETLHDCECEHQHQ